jgi:predicted alpha/beta superfamily hydrolase
MRTFLIIGSLLIFLSFTRCTNPEKQPNDPSVRHAINFTQYSTFVKDTFHIDIQLPEGYFEDSTRHYPTVFLVDGNFYFPMMAAAVQQYSRAGLQEPSIVVGIGYRTFQYMDSLRTRDYLYPAPLPSDEMTTGGGGENFYSYMVQELIPLVHAGYRTQVGNSALLGHSFGGYFVLYALLREAQQHKANFTTFITASPTLWYNNFYLNQLPGQLAKDSVGRHVVMTVGGKEDATWAVAPVMTLAAELGKNNDKSLQFIHHVYSDLDHMDVAMLSFTVGLREAAALGREKQNP